MKLEGFLALLRHGMTFGGGALVSNGMVNQVELDGAVGAVITLAGLAWSLYRKWKRQAA